MEVGADPSAVLYVVVCAAPAAADVHTLVTLAQEAGWRVVVITTPMGARLVDVAEIERLTGDRVRSQFRMPGEPDQLPPADAVIVAPATFNTMNKWANGIADNFAVGLLCELMGFGVPIVAAPLLKEELARHIAFRRSLDALREMNVRVLFNPHAPPHARMPLWEQVMAELHDLL
ncbi:flavoprotein [Sphaerisporangium aureirubrum]|uniref:Flavoprotein n=1 Tax=Sphaerisporangium aureirubrum TaxID=1544736 RepID=A0ABW1NX04_9ACTN